MGCVDMKMEHQDMADYMDMKCSYGLGYELEDIKKVFITGGFEYYSYHFLNYMLVVLSNTAKIGKRPTYSGGNDHRFNKLGFIREVGAVNYRNRTLEFMDDFVPKLAVEIARLTLTNTSDAPLSSFKSKEKLRVLEEQFGVDIYLDYNDKLIELFWEVYYTELKGKYDDSHMRCIDRVVGGLEVYYFKRLEPGYKNQILRYQ